MKNGLVSAILGGVIIAASGTALIKSLVDGYYDSLPHVTYLVNGKEAMTRNFDTNEELHKYMESEKGKQETEYFTKLNSMKNK